jgi:vanillate monooxygenase ferredoxin subunit
VERSWLTVRVAKKRAEAEDVFSFELLPPEGVQLPAFSAGSHIDVEVQPGLIRQYSLCNHPAERNRYLIAVLREHNSRGGSVAMIDGVQAGQALRISEPRNHFTLEPDARRVKLFAGGIGITPILCMAEQLAHSNVPFTFHYANRTRSRAAFLQRIESSSFADRVQWHFDDGAAGRMPDIQSAVGSPEPGTHLYVCGPTGFIKAVLETAERAHWPSSHLHREYFLAAEPVATASEGAFSVRIASTGVTLAVPPDKAVIDVLADHGIDVPVSCKQGVCGTCLTRVLKGTPEHRDLFMTDAEHSKNDQFTPCCSRSKTSLLILDL